MPRPHPDYHCIVADRHVPEIIMARHAIELVRGITRKQLHAYLERTGWTVQTGQRPNDCKQDMDLLSEPWADGTKGIRWKAFLPTEQSPLYERELSRFLDELSACENRRFSELIAEITEEGMLIDGAGI